MTREVICIVKSKPFGSQSQIMAGKKTARLCRDLHSQIV